MSAPADRAAEARGWWEPEPTEALRTAAKSRRISGWGWLGREDLLDALARHTAEVGLPKAEPGDRPLGWVDGAVGRGGREGAMLREESRAALERRRARSAAQIEAEAADLEVGDVFTKDGLEWLRVVDEPRRPGAGLMVLVRVETEAGSKRGVLNIAAAKPVLVKI
jgi:hypothetical protein